MKIVVDENIAFAKEAFSLFGEVELYPGREINNGILKDADVLIIRSVTTVNESLLKNTNIKFVGTTTIGWDHLDTVYLGKNNISYTSAAGCNSEAVAEYVIASLYDIASRKGISLLNKQIGIIGVGNIGSIVARYSHIIGMEVKLNDPPLARKNISGKYLPIEELFNSDIITLHVPLNMEGEDKTYHLFDEKKLEKLKEGSILINTSRGSVIDNDILPEYLKQKNITAVLDVWENEPLLNKELLALTDTATPHVAGYSAEGKINGTIMIYKALCTFAGYNPGWKYNPPPPEEDIISVSGNSVEQQVNNIIKYTYDIRKDDAELKKALTMDSMFIPAYFDLLRKKYILRKEYQNYKVSASHPEVKQILSGLGFRLITD
jgi:erythronate-4-phosphate dehydrogenase